MAKALTLSIVIPAYNEEDQIEGCLEAIAAQSVAPDEVIVVDNNCTDRTVEIAKRFPFVKLVHEPNQGLIAARNHGFDAAKSDILGRIDCDAKINRDWVERVKIAFQDSETQGLTGLAVGCTVPYVPWGRSKLWPRLYFIESWNYLRLPVMWGSNMAIRASAWKQIAKQTSARDNEVHEDQDMSILMSAHHMPIIFDKKLIISVDGEQFGYLPKFIEYAHRRGTTLKHHQQLGTLTVARQFAAVPRLRSALMRVVLIPWILIFLVFAVFDTIIYWILHRSR